MRFQAPRGTHDVLPGQATAWVRLESTFREVARLYGYGEVRTPVFEDTELFTRTSGETSEIVTKQMYTFVDKGDRSLTLKPEGTAPAIRSYLEHQLGAPGTVTRLSYVTPFFRYERPQKGRYRQAHQAGLELIGSPSPMADAEIIEMTLDFYRRIGLVDLKVLVNCIGRAATRLAYGEALLRFVEPWLLAQSPEMQERAKKNPLRLLDSKDPDMINMLQEAPSIGNFLEDESRHHMDGLLCALTESGAEYEVATGIVRGLDYYTDTVFEIHSTHLGAQAALCGGGRYDNLVSDIGGAATPAVGVGIGLERALIVLEEIGKDIGQATPPAFLVAATEGAQPYVRKLARSLRSHGVAAIFDLDGKALKGQLKAADRAGSRYAVIVGDDEMASGAATVKNLETGEQAPCPFDELATRLAS
ncbi:MAG: Histidine--tRNA ligase [Fimbriimonadaceae bacterium]|nr:Histidine--tRNA ligase [Fimbriimonadaceae bacterium]